MRAITVFRAMAWLAVAIVFWSLNMRWGVDTGVAGGPPNAAWERFVVGAGVLAIVAALALSLSGRKATPPSWVARGIAALGAGLILIIALYLWSRADGLLASAIDGPGWTWLAVGGGIAAGAAVGTFGLKQPLKKSKQLSRTQSRKKRR